MADKDGTTDGADVTLNPEQKGTPNVETVTLEQANKMVRDAQSAVLADVGRAKKAAEDAIARLNKLEQERLDAELEAAKDDPPALAHIQEKQAHQQTKAELEKERLTRTELEEKLKQWNEEQAATAKERKAREIAARLNVDASKLVNLARFTDGTPEAIEAVAKELPKAGRKLKPDSGSMVGGVMTDKEIGDAYAKNPYDLDIRAKYHQMRREGKR